MGFSGIANLNAAQLTSEELAIAAIYVQLQNLGRDPEAFIAALKKRIATDLPQALRTIFAAVAADVAKLATDKAENTIGAVQGVISGEGTEPTVAKQLSMLERDNLRFFLGEFLQALVDGGSDSVIAIDNFDAADAGLVSLVRFMVKSRPQRIAIVLAHNNEVRDNTDWDNTVADLRARGGRVLQVTPLERPAISEWFNSEIGRWPTETELNTIEASTHGRAMAIRLAIDAIHDGSEQPIQPDYAGYYERSRRGLSSDARTVAELLAVINRDALVPQDMLAAAAENMNVDNIGPALDDLRDRRLLKETGQNIALAHSLAQNSWLGTINTPRLGRLAQAWFAVVQAYDIARLTAPETTGLIPIITGPLIGHRVPAEIAEIGERLIAVGQVRPGLELIDRIWKFKAEGSTGGGEVLQHAIIAARTRLELGRYGEVDEPLAYAARWASDPDARVQVLLLQMNLALRRNVYPAIWEFARQLEGETERTTAAKIEAEHTVNVAYRDLLDLDGIRASCARLLAFREICGEQHRNSIDRTLARSFAKLGENETALTHAKAAVDSSAALGSIRVVGNSHLALAEVLRYRSEFQPAISAYRHAASIARATGNRDSQLWSLLGEAAAHIEADSPARASGPLGEIAALLAEQGYDHPLETAHAGLLALLAGDSAAPAAEVLLNYDQLGITWVGPFLRGFQASKQLSGPTPI